MFETTNQIMLLIWQPIAEMVNWVKLVRKWGTYMYCVVQL